MAATHDSEPDQFAEAERTIYELRHPAPGRTQDDRLLDAQIAQAQATLAVAQAIEELNATLRGDPQ